MGREQQLAEALGLHHVGNPGMDRHRTIGILVKLSFWKMPVAISMTVMPSRQARLAPLFQRASRQQDQSVLRSEWLSLSASFDTVPPLR
ncbi:hypothetical protein X770_32410 [Mesorhizobium sp. LSJC269B00]|nr:hypothetical protein X770_32410 [Mesorhizobium sp. LSJC269B00]